MSIRSRVISSEDNNSNGTYYRRDTHFGSTAHYTSSIVIVLRQVQTDLYAQHEHEKKALTELNKRFRLFVNRVQLLESQNSKLVAQLADFRRQSSDISHIDARWSEGYLTFQSDLTTVSRAKVDYELDFELFQQHSGIYQQLINVEQQWKDQRSLKLEQELNQVASVLITLRTSYGEFEREIANLHATRQDTLKQCLELIHHWRSVKKQRMEWDLSVQTLKNELGFYKNFRSYSVREFEPLSIESGDLTQFWKLELSKSVKRIRRDFELFYATIDRQMTLYYQTKIKEVQRDIEQTLDYQKIEREELAMSQQTLRVEYEQVQKTFSYEKEIRIKLEATYSKFESEFQSIQLQHNERFQLQSEDLRSVQESIMTMASDIDQIRRRKINLEVEILIYRNLLDGDELQDSMVIDPHSSPAGGQMTEKLSVKRQRRGSIGIKECAADGTYISLINHSTSKDIEISRWVLKRRIDSATELRYTIPDGVRLQRGRELRIYSKLGAAAAGSQSDHRVVSSLLHQELVNNDLVSWGTGNTIETLLFNENGEEKASYSQSIGFGRNI